MRKKRKIGYKLKQVSIAHEQKLNVMLQEQDIKMSQVRVLMYLFQSDRKEVRVNQRDIELYLDISNPTVTGILNRLESKGLIKRIAKKDDARVRYVHATEKAKDLESMIHHNFKENEEKLLTGFTKEERDSLDAYLDRMLRNIS